MRRISPVRAPAQTVQLFDHLDSLLLHRDILADMDRLEHGRDLTHFSRGDLAENHVADFAGPVALEQMPSR
jgi:hypothetical protein